MCLHCSTALQHHPASPSGASSSKLSIAPKDDIQTESFRLFTLKIGVDALFLGDSLLRDRQTMDNQNVNLQVLRSPEPTAEAARKADERRRIAELECDIKELGSALEARDREVSIHSAKRTVDSQTRATTPAAAVGDCAAPQPEQLSTPADMFSTPDGVSPRIGRFASIRAIQQQPKFDLKSGPSAGRRKLVGLRGVVIGVLSFMSGGALIHWAPAIGDHSRSVSKRHGRNAAAYRRGKF